MSLSEQDAIDHATRLGVSRETFPLIRMFELELARWQRRINLVGQRSPEAFWTHDVADAIAMSQLIPRAKLMDWGSGAGLPGILWLLLEQDRQLVSVEANAKKAAFQRHVLRQLPSIEGSTVLNHRIEDISPAIADEIDWITARALTDLPQLLSLWIGPRALGRQSAVF